MLNKRNKSLINRNPIKREQLLEDWARLSNIGEKKENKNNIATLIETKKTVNGVTFAVIQEGKDYFVKYSNKADNLTTNDFKYIGGEENRGKVEKYPSIIRASNRMRFICESLNKFEKNNNEDEESIDNLDGKDKSPEDNYNDSTDSITQPTDSEVSDEDGDENSEPSDSEIEPSTDSPEKPVDTTSEPSEVSSDSEENQLLNNIDKAAASDDAASSSGSDELGGGETDMSAGSTGSAPDLGGGDASAPTDVPSDTSDAPDGDVPGDILNSLGDTSAGGEQSDNTAPEGDESDSKKELTQTIGKLGNDISQLKDQNLLTPEDIKNAFNSLISAVGDTFSQVSNDDKEAFATRIRNNGAKLNDDGKSDDSVSSEDEKSNENSPSEVSKEPMDKENLNESRLKILKEEASNIIKEQLKKHLDAKKKKQLIENIIKKLA